MTALARARRAVTVTLIALFVAATIAIMYGAFGAIIIAGN